MKSEEWLGLLVTSNSRNVLISDGTIHFFCLNLASAAAVAPAPLSTILGRPAADADGGLLARAAEDDDEVLSAADDLQDAATDARCFTDVWLADLLVCFTSADRFGGWTTPILGLARRGIGAGLVLGLRDLERETLAALRSAVDSLAPARSVDVAAGLVVVRRAAALAALAELAADDTESQLDTDVLASDVLSREDTPVSGFLTMNWFTITDRPDWLNINEQAIGCYAVTTSKDITRTSIQRQNDSNYFTYWMVQ